MFQSYETRSEPQKGPARLKALRAQMVAEDLQGFMVPRADVHQGEYVAERDARLGWLTGFQGSAGFCVALENSAGVFIDGRYTVQVKSQVDLAHFTPVAWPKNQAGDWLNEHAPSGAVIGFDPWLHTVADVERTDALLSKTGRSLRPCQNLVDAIWEDQPEAPRVPAFVHPVEFAGESHAEKRARMAQVLRDAGEDHAVITLPDSICWLLNIRGHDVAHNPVVQSLLILHADGRVDLFIDPAKTADISDHLGADITCHPQDDFARALTQLTGTVRVDPVTAPFAVASILQAAGCEISRNPDPCILPKAIKNDTELAGMRAAHLRDGAAMAEFLCWLHEAAPKGGLSEVAAAQKLEGFRRATNALFDISFETISATGPHAPICHYRVTEDTNLPIEQGQLFLIDSGGQYKDGTTDITRTIAVGEVGMDEKQCFTRVLQGMIALSRARWPRGLSGRDLDPIARYPIWLAGHDFDHGTGHGVGAFLSVHEGPARISKVSDIPLEPGMILSNEPGYYREGAFGIRIENLVAVQTAGDLPGADARDMLDFETLAYTPIDRNLIVTEMLSGEEKAWLDAYHAKTFELLADAVSEATQNWLRQACAPL
ncbi:aminopeptidase P family protein [Halocynthiibacter styelae]|uniref:Aminopeptidase P family protein n=1 Tax=Halocynthiibacter styelae TaxID=2761955 RepID=A0A8J7LPV7_9RHOB|nr:aminopeptidase P family protein [Paenihalocynthiibacter styelae]MBI1493352.1 aminopeptidase P family protein [Paenihalocynthiibacter styelae]